VVDAFYLTDSAGRPLSPARANDARAAVQGALEPLRPPTVNARF
jgi:hypothetical protein